MYKKNTSSTEKTLKINISGTTVFYLNKINAELIERDYFYLDHLMFSESYPDMGMTHKCLI